MGREGSWERKRHGRHYTPAPLARFLAERIATHAPPDRPALHILDPACGDGELLFALSEILTRRLPQTRLTCTGYDLDPTALDTARNRAAHQQGAEHGRYAIQFRWRGTDFLAACADLDACSFDIVITNPPYVRTQQLGGPAAEALRRQFDLRGRIDLTHPFVAALPRLLTPDGVLGLLCANRFLTTKAGANLRAVLSRDLTPRELYDLGDTKLFDAAVLPAVTIAVRAENSAQCRYVSVYQEDSPATPDLPDAPGRFAGAPPTAESVSRVVAPRDADGHRELFAALSGPDDAVVWRRGRRLAVRVGELEVGPAGGSGSDPVGWRMARVGREDWLCRVRETMWTTFGDLARIRVGIKTNADRVFIAENWGDADTEPELLRDLITHHDLRPWRIERARPTRVLYPYDADRRERVPVDLAHYPRTAAYLESHRETLSARTYLASGTRKWFEIWVPQRPHLWGLPKIVFPDISDRPRFALDRSGAVVNGDCYWISLPDLGAPDRAEHLALLLMGVANSTLGLRYYDAVCGNRLYSGRRRWITQYVARLPLPDPGSAAAAQLVCSARALVEGREPDPAALSELDDLVGRAFALPAR